MFPILPVAMGDILNLDHLVESDALAVWLSKPLIDRPIALRWARNEGITDDNHILVRTLVATYSIARAIFKIIKVLEKSKKWFHNEFGNYVNELNVLFVKKRKIVDKKYYNYPLSRNPSMNKIDNHNWWINQWILGKCEAKLLSYYLQNNFTITRDNFEKDKIKIYHKNEC
ncbi:hypothetical protein WH47_00463 [Habropoda laboriosa]|uniref:Uncharacterized protein n=1 Tax=Habropoda laboriosa TaxID=597456 RepID=A0A0L7R7C0_9HYME|nr:hypothetical protein WH47_00463 [Habropoda laboriosa]